MNIETGKIYRTPEEIKAALDRGEPLVPVSDYVAGVVEEGHRAMNRKERRKAAAIARRAERAAKR